MSDDAAILAGQFAHALKQLGTTWDLQYVGAGAMPEPPPQDAVTPEDAARPEDEPAAPETSTSSTESSPASAERSSASAEPSPARASTPAPSEPAAPRRVVAVRAATPPESESPKAEDAPAQPVPIADPTQRAEAARARQVALREQAQRWSPATKLEYLRRHNVGDCRRCPLARTRNQIVFGVGNPQADLMFVGEAPGADEDRTGEPFVGRAGQLLNRWLVSLGMKREDVYIANVLKCRPPGNRDPKPEEVDRCSPFLQAQIRAIEPKVIVALGRHAGMLLSRREDMTLRAMRSTSRLQYDAGAPKGNPNARIRIPLVVTYHPAYVLRQEGDGRRPPPGRTPPTQMVMTDLRRALSIAGIEAPHEPR